MDQKVSFPTPLAEPLSTSGIDGPCCQVASWPCDSVVSVQVGGAEYTFAFASRGFSDLFVELQTCAFL